MIFVAGTITFDSSLVEDLQNFAPDFKASHNVEVLLKIDAKDSSDVPGGFDSIIDVIEVICSESIFSDTCCLDDEILTSISDTHDLTGQLSLNLVDFNAVPASLKRLNDLFIISAVEYNAVTGASDSE